MILQEKVVRQFRYVPYGEKFFNGSDWIEYTKTNHMRGYTYDENGRKVFRNFKKHTLVGYEPKD